MHEIQEKLLELSKTEDITILSLRAMAEAIGLEGHSPQKIKHHLLQLQKKGLLLFNEAQEPVEVLDVGGSWLDNIAASSLNLFSIPILGSANCGPAALVAEQNLESVLRVTSKLVGRSKPDGLYCIKASGDSMNRTDIDGKNIEDGDFIIVDCKDRNAKTGDVVLAVIDNMATVKKFIRDEKNNQIVLMAESSTHYDPIFLHADDNFMVNARVIGVVKEPKH